MFITMCCSTFPKSASSMFNEEMKPTHDCGGIRSCHSDGNPYSFSTMLLWCVVRFLKEMLNMVVLQESEQVNTALDVEKHMRF